MTAGKGNAIGMLHPNMGLVIRHRLILAPTILLVALGSGASLSHADEPPGGVYGPNLAQNGSFEDGDQTPAFWRWGVANNAQATLTLDDEVAHSGKRSIRLHSASGYAPNVYGGIAQDVTGLVPGSEYVIRLWARGKGVGVC